MDENYISHTKPKKRWGIIFLLVVILLIALSGIFLWFKGSQKIISPVPPQPSFEVIFYTPTPLHVTPTLVPSATPKVKPTIVPTKGPTPTAKVTSAATPSATIKPAATLTPKP